MVAFLYRLRYAITMKNEKKVLEVDGMQISYLLNIKKVKNLNLRISSQGELIITCNEYIPIAKVEAFAKEKVRWILKHQQKQMQKSERRFVDIQTQSVFYLYNQRLNIVRIQSNQNSVRYDDENFYVYYIKEEDMNKSVAKFIKKICEQDFYDCVTYYYEKMKDYRFTFPVVKYRVMKSRWGSCIPKKNQITLNTYLLHYPKEFMEYVVLHELAHFVEPNHSKSFYHVIENHMPDYKKRQKLVV